MKDLFKSRYQWIINLREKFRTKKVKKSKAFVKYSQTINDLYENLEDYNPKKKSVNSVSWYDSRYES